MSETAATAGALLRAAREKQNLALTALAAATKVPPRKLDALERDRLDELPDVTFARALARSVCRHLRIDAAPILALLPPAEDAGVRRLEQLSAGLAAPVALAGAAGAGEAGGWLRRPVVWIAALLLGAAALLLYGQPEVVARWWAQVATPASPAAAPAAAPPAAVAPPVAEAASAPVAAEPAAATPAAAPTGTAPIVETVHSAPGGAAPAAAPAGVLVLEASGESWVEVRDAAGQVLLSRTLLAGEAVGLDGALPLRATIGNAGATQVSFRGTPVDLAPATRDNIARLELK
jgi:cytoskeleton protein RodZ